MIAALVLPAAANARDYDVRAPGWDGARPTAAWGGGRPGGAWGGGRPENERAYGGGFGGQGGFGDQGGFGGYRARRAPEPQMIYHGIPGFGGYARPRVRDPDDWNDYGAQRGESWRRGQLFPQGARGAIVGDYARYHLRRPPPGYYWYRSGDDFILAAIASGLIFEVAPADGY